MNTGNPPARLRAERLEARDLPATFNGETIEPLRLPGPEDYRVRSDAMVKAFQAAPVVGSLAVGYSDPATFGSWRVRLYQDLASYQDFQAYYFTTTNADKIHVAVGDVTGDGVTDVITGPGQRFYSTGAPAPSETVRVYDGTSLGSPNPVPLRAFLPETYFRGGFYVTTGDVDRDGYADVIVSTDRDETRVWIYSGAEVADPAVTALTPLAAFDPIGQSFFFGGAHCAVGDVNGDGVPDLVAGAGVGGGPRVAVWDGTTLRPGQTPARVCNDFFALDPNSRTGIHVAVADVNRDGYGDVLAGPQSGPPQMAAFDAADLVRGTLTLRWSRLYGDTSSTGGLRMVARDLDGDGVFDLALSHSDRPRVTTVRGQFLAPDGTIFSAGPFDAGPTGVKAGVWVG